ncbi:hypothetical protein LINGRAHAP2_LOCUS18403 [Linum grandiflorum]
MLCSLPQATSNQVFYRLVIPACFTSNEDDEPAAATTMITRPGQAMFMSVYNTNIAGKHRLITITWCKKKNLMLHTLSISVSGQHEFKIEIKPWSFWRKHGAKQFEIDGKAVEVVWDLKSARFDHGETEPKSDYYVAIVCQEEVVLLLGDLKIDAFLKTRCRPSLNEPSLVSRREHVFGRKRFTTRIRFHEISLIQSSNEMEILVDGEKAIEVKHLQWKFRGNQSMCVSKNSRVEVYWDVHDWLFGSAGPRHGLFIFKPVDNHGDDDDENGGSSSFCLFLYAWKVE